MPHITFDVYICSKNCRFFYSLLLRYPFILLVKITYPGDGFITLHVIFVQITCSSDVEIGKTAPLMYAKYDGNFSMRIVIISCLRPLSEQCCNLITPVAIKNFKVI